MYDSNGNLTTDENNYRFVYDAWNRVVQVKNASNVVLVTYGRDALHRHVTDTVGSTVTDRFFSSDWQLLETKVGSNTVTRNVWSPVYVDGLVLRDRDTDANGTLDERLYALQDANWNTTALINTSGTTQERYTYTPFGQVTFRDSSGSTLSSSAKDWVFLHQGGERIAAGDYEFRNRIYSPTLGRWLSNDPLGFDAGDQNLSRYSNNNPTNFLDSLGLAAVGHHWVPISALTDVDISRWLSLDAYQIGMGAYSGPTDPPHCFNTYGGVSHAEYNKLIKEELKNLIKKNNGKTISASKMIEFIENIRNGKDHTGTINPKIQAFNNAISAERANYIAINPKKRGFQNTQGPSQWQNQGKWYLEGPGRNRINGKAVIKGAMIVSAIGGWILYDTPNAMACASESNHFRMAMKSFSIGEISKAECHLFGAGNSLGSNCFYQELMDKVDPKFAILFREGYYAKIEEINRQCENPIMRYTRQIGK